MKYFLEAILVLILAVFLTFIFVAFCGLLMSS